MEENINETVRLIKRDKFGEDLTKVNNLPEEMEKVYVSKRTSKKNKQSRISNRGIREK